MCGIAGVWGRVEDTLVRNMLAKQAHRGPDERGIHAEKERGKLGHVRLSIIDTFGGRQPIYNEDGSAVIIANGEIYNHKQLREKLSQRHKFSTKSDIETILHLFEDKGQNLVFNLDGMFAFALADGEELFLARDKVGIKPLYYSLDNCGKSGEALYFASELKAFSKWAGEVSEFPPGSYYHSEEGFKSYYSVPKRTPTDLPVEVYTKELRWILEKAVKKRLMSDVPLGSFLSGGLDSSIIAAIASSYMDGLHTFSVGTAGSSDLEAARFVADYIGSTHHEYIYTEKEVAEKLPEIIYHLESFDQDLVRSAIPTYFCSRLASDWVKVILTGEGADELFAGYTYYKDIEDREALHKELHRSVGSLHNVNLQRVDPMNMSHSIEGRVPFLDTELIEMAQSVPPELKLKRTADGREVEKWILRKSVEDLLPDEIVWRDKEQFDEGSGTVDLLEEVISSQAKGIDPDSYSAKFPEDNLRSLEECFYHKLLLESFESPELVLRNVGRWQTEYL